MRTVFVGAGSLALMTARLMLERGHDVVIVERDKERVDTLAGELDAGFLHGDGSTPAVLKEADPAHSDILFCLTGNDQANILASLVGRSLGFKRVVTKIEDPEYQHVCLELGLEDTIIPTRTIAYYLADTARGINTLELSSVLKDDARIFSLVARDEDAMSVGEMELPDGSRVICLYRNNRFVPVDEGTAIKPGDEVVLITRDKIIDKLAERWGPNRVDRSAHLS